MNPFTLTQTKAARIGNLAGWALAFDRVDDNGRGVDTPTSLVVLDSDRYNAASLEVSLDSSALDASGAGSVGGGRARIVLEGLTDGDYEKIHPRAADPRRMLKLYLYWRDANASVGGALLNAVGLSALAGAARPPADALVAVLWVDRIARRVGSRLLEAEITASDFVAHQLAARLAEPLKAKGPGEAAEQAARRARVPIAPHDPPPPRDGDARTFDAGVRLADVFGRIAAALESRLNKRGRGMLMVRDGELHVGPRPIPLPAGAGGDTEAKELTAASGLLAAEPTRTDAPDPDAPDARQTPRAEFKITLKGRPDLKPGDTVKFDPPSQDVPAKTTPGLGAALLGAFSSAAAILPGLSGALGAGTATLYVHAVRHALGRTSGFVTEVTGLVLPDPGQPWDERAEGRGPSAAAPAAPPPSADGAVGLARAIAHAARSAVAAPAGPEIAEVRAANPAGASEPPGQTTTVWRGLAPADGRPRAARRLAPRRETPAPLGGVPMATPFAWGKCGLIVPRYPGTRVLLVHRNGDDDDPIDVGAVVESGRATAEAKAGDWWLILPVGVPASKRQGLPDGKEPPEPHGGKATNDLIDADGKRAIEVAELTIRVGDATLKAAGTRPAAPGVAGSLTIEHSGGASIVLMPDGTVRIKGKTLEFQATEGNVSLKAAGAINLEAASVDVKVSGQMKVHG